MKELITHFGIDWKLLLAQAANFLILLFILKRYAYGPILKMMKARKADIEKGVTLTKEAERKLSEMETLKSQTLREARNEALDIVKRGEVSGEERKAEILSDTAKKTEAMMDETKRRMREEELKMKEEVSKNAEELVRLTVGKVLGKMPADDRDTKLIRQALDEMSGALKHI